MQVQRNGSLKPPTPTEPKGIWMKTKIPLRLEHIRTYLRWPPKLISKLNENTFVVS